MAKSSKPKAPTFVTPKLRFVYPKLAEPDYGTKEFPKEDGEFSTKAVGLASDAEVKAFIAKLQPFHDAAIKHAEELFKGLKVDQRKKLGKLSINSFYTELFDEETEEPTGEVEFKFAMKHLIKVKNGPKAGKVFKKYPAIFDAKGNVMKPVPDIWGGTIGRVSFELGMSKDWEIPGYFIPSDGKAGISLKLQAVRIIELVQGGQRDASAYGFDGEEEGYTYSADDVKSDDTSDTNENKNEGQAGGAGAGDDNNPDF